MALREQRLRFGTAPEGIIDFDRLFPIDPSMEKA
jgi:hypothetical protein